MLLNYKMFFFVLINYILLFVDKQNLRREKMLSPIFRDRAL